MGTIISCIQATNKYNVVTEGIGFLSDIIKETKGNKLEEL